MPNNQQPQPNDPRQAQPGRNPERREDQDIERDGGHERERREREEQQKRPQ